MQETQSTAAVNQTSGNEVSKVMSANSKLENKERGFPDHVLLATTESSEVGDAGEVKEKPHDSVQLAKTKHDAGSVISKALPLKQMVEPKRDKVGRSEDTEQTNDPSVKERTHISVLNRMTDNASIKDVSPKSPVTKKREQHLPSTAQAPVMPVKVLTVGNTAELSQSHAASSSSSKSRSLVLTLTTCYICRQEFKCYEQLKVHMKEHEAGSDNGGSFSDKACVLISCGICGHECPKDEMGDHFKIHGIQDEDSNEFKMDLGEVEDTGNVDGAVSDDAYENTEEDGRRSREIDEGVSSKVIHCGICDQEIAADELSSHMVAHNNQAEARNVEDLYTCTLENEQSGSDDISASATNPDKSVFRKSYHCKKCGYKTDRQTRMREHVRACCGAEAQFGCRICGRVYKLKRNMLSHLKMHSGFGKTSPHRNVPYKGFTCSQCDYNTPSMSRYIEHLQSCAYGVQETHGCEVCGKVFRLRKYLNKHRKCHRVGTDYVCKMCDFKTESGVQLGQHIKTCKPFAKDQCRFCKKMFHSNRDVIKHLSSGECKSSPSKQKREPRESGSENGRSKLEQKVKQEPSETEEN